MASALSSKKGSSKIDIDIEKIIEQAKNRWLKPAEVEYVLRNYKKYEFNLCSKPPSKPGGGSLFLFDKKACRYFRKDGHSWQKKRDGKNIKEAHEKLKAGSLEILHCYYARGEENERFQRRCYWLLESSEEHVVLVHYLETSETPIKARGMSGKSPFMFSLEKSYRRDGAADEQLTFPAVQGKCTDGEAEKGPDSEGCCIHRGSSPGTPPQGSRNSPLKHYDVVEEDFDFSDLDSDDEDYEIPNSALGVAVGVGTRLQSVLAVNSEGIRSAEDHDVITSQQPTLHMSMLEIDNVTVQHDSATPLTEEASKVQSGARGDWFGSDGFRFEGLASIQVHASDMVRDHCLGTIVDGRGDNNLQSHVHGHQVYRDFKESIFQHRDECRSDADWVDHFISDSGQKGDSQQLSSSWISCEVENQFPHYKERGDSCGLQNVEGNSGLGLPEETWGGGHAYQMDDGDDGGPRRDEMLIREMQPFAEEQSSELHMEAWTDHEGSPGEDEDSWMIPEAGNGNNERLRSMDKHRLQETSPGMGNVDIRELQETPVPLLGGGMMLTLDPLPDAEGEHVMARDGSHYPVDHHTGSFHQVCSQSSNGAEANLETGSPGTPSPNSIHQGISLCHLPALSKVAPAPQDDSPGSWETTSPEVQHTFSIPPNEDLSGSISGIGLSHDSEQQQQPPFQRASHFPTPIEQSHGLLYGEMNSPQFQVVHPPPSPPDRHHHHHHHHYCICYQQQAEQQHQLQEHKNQQQQQHQQRPESLLCHTGLHVPQLSVLRHPPDSGTGTQGLDYHMATPADQISSSSVSAERVGNEALNPVQLMKRDAVGTGIHEEVDSHFLECFERLMIHKEETCSSPLGQNDNPCQTSSSNHRFFINDLAPSWVFTRDHQTKVLIAGHVQDSSVRSWFCKFGDEEVEAEVVQEGVLRCKPPVHGKAGKVLFSVTCGDGNSCSNARVFEYRNKGMDVEDMGLLVRLVRVVLSDETESNLASQAVRTGLDRNQGPLGEWEWLLREELTTTYVQEQLLQMLLRRRLSEWLHKKRHEAFEMGNASPAAGFDLLDDTGMGVVHFAAALGFDWAISIMRAAQASLDACDFRGRTPLHWASAFGREVTVATLLAAGATPGLLLRGSMEHQDGWTAAEIAEMGGHEGISGMISLKLLEESQETMSKKGPVGMDLMTRIQAQAAGHDAVARVTNTVSPTPGFNVMATHLDDPNIMESREAIRRAGEAAALIQAMYRRYYSRKLAKEQKRDQELRHMRTVFAARVIQRAYRGYQRQRTQAATKIQKVYKGWKGRREFLQKRKRIVKLQAQWRCQSQRKQYIKMKQALAVLAVAIIRWRNQRKKSQERQLLKESQQKEAMKALVSDKLGERWRNVGGVHSQRAIELAVVRVQAIARTQQAQLSYRQISEEYMAQKAQYDAQEPAKEPAALELPHCRRM